MRNLIDKALNGATSCCRLRHLTTVGTGWSALGPAPGKERWPSPGGGRGSWRMTYEEAARSVVLLRRRAGECLLLDLVELGLCDRAAVQQFLALCDLLSRIALRCD